MKEATGELNMTVVTVIAIAAIATLLGVLWPKISETIDTKWNDVSGRELDHELSD